MENFLRSKEFWSVVNIGVQEPTTGIALSEAQKAELNGLRLKDLKKKYKGTTKAKMALLQSFRANFETLQIKMRESVSEYFSRTMAIANKMRIHGEKLEDVTIIEKILRFMSSKFNYVVCSTEESKETNELSINELQSSLLIHEQKMNRQTSKEQALQLSSN
ncbi:uncharacterized protein LOC125847019 [Solanum stenotomum]|uniref:uncharacterized protein LOC125847019 n=1 Tax=Solanum stenotomum TaxID=172797 RepID=UPI0020D18165|nr:uncharacterized protein LOC125847019 [Solanum stenotomum]